MREGLLNRGSSRTFLLLGAEKPAMQGCIHGAVKILAHFPTASWTAIRSGYCPIVHQQAHRVSGGVRQIALHPGIRSLLLSMVCSRRAMTGMGRMLTPLDNRAKNINEGLDV